MHKEGELKRDIKFMSAKNGEMRKVHSDAAYRFAMHLEEDAAVQGYECGVPFDRSKLLSVSRTSIRSRYFDEAWTSDFYVRYTDGSSAVFEVVSPDAYMKIAEVEKMELSRRYWAMLGIRRWVIAEVKKGGGK